MAREVPMEVERYDALSSSEDGSSLDEPSWISWFCLLRHHELFCEVDPAYIQVLTPHNSVIQGDRKRGRWDPGGA